MIKCENCIMPKLLKCGNIAMLEKLDDSCIEKGFLQADIELLREDLKEAYDAIVSIMDHECCNYNMGDIYEKASAYIEEYERSTE